MHKDDAPEKETVDFNYMLAELKKQLAEAKSNKVFLWKVTTNLLNWLCNQLLWLFSQLDWCDSGVATGIGIGILLRRL